MSQYVLEGAAQPSVGFDYAIGISQVRMPDDTEIQSLEQAAPDDVSTNSSQSISQGFFPLR